MSFLVDSFTEASTINLTAHTPETGGAWSKITGTSNDLNVNGGGGYATGATTSTAVYRNAATPPSADYSVEATVQHTLEGFVGVIGRASSSANTLYQLFYAGSLHWYLERVVGGTATNLGGYDVALATNTDAVVKLEMIGTSIKAYINGVERISVTDSSITAAGFAGVRTRSNGKIFNVVAAEIGGAATATTLSGPSSGTTGVPSSNFTVGANGTITGTVTVTPNDGGDGGTFAPTSVAISSGTPTATFTYTPASTGVKGIGATNDGGLSNPTSINYTSNAAASTHDPVLSQRMRMSGYNYYGARR